jgi:hypothetical protein
MSDQKSLDEALDEMDRWEDHVADALESLSPDEVLEYFRQSQLRLEQQTGKQLNLPVRSAPSPTGSGV